MQTPIYLTKIDFVLNYLFFEQQSEVGVACHQLAGCSWAVIAYYEIPWAIEQTGLEAANPAPKVLQWAESGVCMTAALGSMLQRTRRVDASMLSRLNRLLLLARQPAHFGPSGNWEENGYHATQTLRRHATQTLLLPNTCKQLKNFDMEATQQRKLLNESNHECWEPRFLSVFKCVINRVSAARPFFAIWSSYEIVCKWKKVWHPICNYQNRCTGLLWFLCKRA